MAREAWKEAKRVLDIEEQINKYKKYQDDPVGFGEEVLGEFYTDDIKRVMESVRDNPVTIAKSANDVGKSHGSARIATWFYVCFEESQVYLTAAPPLENLRRILWGELMSVATKHPNIFVGNKTRSLSMMRTPKSFIAAVAIPTSGSSEEREAKFSGKHAGNILFIVDEGDAVPDEVYRGIESCMSGGLARLLIMFNPRAKAGAVYLKEKMGLANVVSLSAFDHPNVVEDREIIPGAVTRETVVRRINMWTRPLEEDEKIDIECFDIPDYLMGAKAKALDGKIYPPLLTKTRKITQPEFSYMVLGEYPSQGEQHLINAAWVDAARERWDSYVGSAKSSDERVAGLDLAEYGDDSSVLCIRSGGFVHKFTFRSGVDTEFTVPWAVATCQENLVDTVYIDATGIGSGVAAMIARMVSREDESNRLRAIGVKVSSKPSPTLKSELGEFYQLRDQLWWAVREWLRTDPNAMLPPDPYLVEELAIPTYEMVSQSGRIKIMSKDRMRQLLKRSPDRADALCLTFTPIKRAQVVRLTG